jgi:hypothetical protein
MLLSAMNFLSDHFEDLLQVFLVLSSIGKTEKHGKGDNLIMPIMDSWRYSGKESIFKGQESFLFSTPLYEKPSLSNPKTVF